jgi:RNA polymerase sigma factor (sigma-70 family)
VETATADPDAARRRRAALALLAIAEPRFRRTARRFSLCADDADDAFQRAVEILLTKAPSTPPRSLVAWMQVVTRREALAVRRSRERLLGPLIGERKTAPSPVEQLRAGQPGPAEALERRERVGRAASLLATLKPHERRAIALQAEGYSYAEIQALTGWSHTKVNRLLAEGRARMRALGALA